METFTNALVEILFLQSIPETNKPHERRLSASYR